MKKLIDRLQGKPSAVRWVIETVSALIVYLVFYVPIGVVAGFWVYQLPSAVALVWSSIPHMDSPPNTKRTPKKSRPWQRLDDFRDVRARIRELSYPKQ